MANGQNARKYGSSKSVENRIAAQIAIRNRKRFQAMIGAADIEAVVSEKEIDLVAFRREVAMLKRAEWQIKDETRQDAEIDALIVSFDKITIELAEERRFRRLEVEISNVGYWHRQRMHDIVRMTDALVCGANQALRRHQRGDSLAA